MVRQRQKRILMIGMVLILLFSTLTGCNGREEATTPAETTTPLSEAEIQQRMLADWQRVVIQKQECFQWIRIRRTRSTGSLSFRSSTGTCEDAQKIAMGLDSIRELNVAFLGVRSISEPRYCMTLALRKNGSPKNENTKYLIRSDYDFFLVLTEDGTVILQSDAYGMELYSAPGLYDENFLHGLGATIGAVYTDTFYPTVKNFFAYSDITANSRGR